MTVRSSPVIGVCPVLAVPFTDDGDVDLDGFGAVIDHQLSLGVSSVMLFGLASEFHKLADDERGALQAALLDRTHAERDVTAVVSITDHATEVAVRRGLAAAAAGADALNLLPPWFLGPSREQVLAHIAEFVATMPVPVVVQYAPRQTGVTLEPAALAGLAAAHEQLAAVKVESQPPGRFVAALREARPPLPAVVGYAGLQLPDALSRGAVGVQPGCSFTEVYLGVWDRWQAGEETAALELHGRMVPYVSYFMQSVELIVAVEKLVLHRRGIIASAYCRRPSYDLDGEERALVDRFLDAFSAELGA